MGQGLPSQYPIITTWKDSAQSPRIADAKPASRQMFVQMILFEKMPNEPSTAGP